MARRKLPARPVLAPIPAGGDPRRLVPSPVFLLSSIRSGSTLLRVVLNSHSAICAPHEMHLGRLTVPLDNENLKAGMRGLELSQRELENLLWDRVLHLELARSGKSIIVDKTPQNTFNWRRLKRVWPQARYIFLLRHPAQVVESMVKAWPRGDIAQFYEKAERYAVALAEARQRLPGVTVRYEDLTADPTAATRAICSYLGVPWEQSMVDYGSHDHGRFVSRLGDWSSAIKSGTIKPAAPPPPPQEIAAELKKSCELLGYL